MIGFASVTKEEAKRMIDEAPGDMVTIITWNRETLIHQPTERKHKTYGKGLVDLAKSIGFADDEVFQTIYLDGEMKNPNLLRNIMFPKLKPKLE